MDVTKFMAAGNSLTQADLPQATQTWTIKHVDQQQLGQGQKAEEKVCMHFHGHEKFLSMNKTNLKRLVGPPLNWGTNATTWVNRQVQVYRTWTEYKGDAVMGVRLWAPGQTPPDPIIDNPAGPNPLATQASQQRVSVSPVPQQPGPVVPAQPLQPQQPTASASQQRVSVSPVPQQSGPVVPAQPLQPQQPMASAPQQPPAQQATPQQGGQVIPPPTPS